MARKGKRRVKRPTKGLEQINVNAAAVDIGKTTNTVAVPPERDERPVRSFGTTTPDLRAMAAWLEQCGIESVALESTGIYWVPTYEVLEEAGFEVCLVNARDVSRVPGRPKSDVLDCQWLQRLHSFGLLRASFRPTADIVELRSYTRHRSNLVSDASAATQHMQKALGLMNLQLDAVLSDITGKTGMAIVRAIVDGERDPEVLATHRDHRCRAPQQRIVAALTGNYQPEHIFALKQSLESYEHYVRQIADCDAEIERVLERLASSSDAPERPLPQAKKRHKPIKQQPRIVIREHLHQITGVDLTQLPGLAPLSALMLISEIGTDMSAWPTAKAFASWLNLAPGTKITGGRRLSGKRRVAPNRAANILRMAAMNIGRTDTWLGAFYRRLAARTEKPIAVVATAHKLAVIIYTLLKRKQPFNELGAQAYAAAHRENTLRNLKRRAKALGLELVPQQPSVATRQAS